MTQRLKFSPELVVLEIITDQKRTFRASREYGIKGSVLSRCKQEFIERHPQPAMTETNTMPNWSGW